MDRPGGRSRSVVFPGKVQRWPGSINEGDKKGRTDGLDANYRVSEPTTFEWKGRREQRRREGRGEKETPAS